MGENQEILFARTLERVRRAAGEQGNRISSEQVREAFAPLALQQEQLELVFDYLRKRRISIGGPEDMEDGEECLSEEETDYLEEYKRGLALLEEVGEGEREALILSAMAGEREAQNRLIHVYLPQVVEIARLYTGQGVFLEDLIGEGNAALTAGVAVLGCMEGTGEAEGMLMKMIMDAMEALIREAFQESDKGNRIAAHVNRVADKAGELSEELRRKVTAQELSEETGMSVKAIRDAMRMSGYTIEGLER